MINLVKEAIFTELISLDGFRDAKTKRIYEDLISTPPPPKILSKLSLDWDLVWSRLKSSVTLCSQVREGMSCSQ